MMIVTYGGGCDDDSDRNERKLVIICQKFHIFPQRPMSCGGTAEKPVQNFNV